MAKELEERSVTRAEAADQLERIADDIRTGDSLDVDVNNRTVHLSPPENLVLELSVRETSSLFRSDGEGITIKLDWKVS